ncbi:MAG: hypothetical protein ACOYNF_00140, partial [Rhodoferax sp.]
MPFTPGRPVALLGAQRSSELTTKLLPSSEIATRLLHVAYSDIEKHGTFKTLGHWVGHKIDDTWEYSVEQKLNNEKKILAAKEAISAPGKAASVALAAVITGASLGTLTPVALAALAAGTWASDKIADGATALLANQFRQKRIRSWLTKHPEAAMQLGAPHLRRQSIVDACDSIRRAVDHFRKSRAAGSDLVMAIKQTKYGDFTNCSEMVTVVKKEMKWLHEIYKTELYLVPALDLAIMLKNTQLGLCGQWADFMRGHREALAQFITQAKGSGNCGDIWKKLALEQVVHKNDGLNGYVEASRELADDLQYLLRLREYFGTNLRHQLSAMDGPVSALKRFDALIVDAAKYYNSPGLIKRSGHYVGNSFTRSTAGEIVTGAVSAGLSLATSVATGALAGIAPGVLKPLKTAAETGINFLAENQQSINFLQATVLRFEILENFMFN